MTYEIERKILNGKSLNLDEIDSFLTFICNLIRNDVGIDNPLDTNCMVCNETSLKFGRLMFMKFGLDVESLNIKQLLQIPLTHYANTISFTIDGKVVNYLVDMTFSQFFSETIRLDDIDGKNGELVSTDNSFKIIEDDPFVYELRYKGFVKLDENILSKYIVSFMNLCNKEDNDKLLDNVKKRVLKK